MADVEVSNEEQPSLADVDQLYEDGKLQQLIEAAVTLLDEDMELNRYHTIQLLIFAATSVKDPADTVGYVNRDQEECRRARLSHREPDEVRELDKLGVDLERVRVVGERGREEAKRAEEMEDIECREPVKELARGASDFVLPFDYGGHLDETLGLKEEDKQP